MTGVFLEDDVIKLGDLFAAWPIPELEDGGHQSNARHLVRKTILGQQIEGGGMGRGRPWARWQISVAVKPPDRQPPAPEQPRPQQADRPPPGNQSPPFV